MSNQAKANVVIEVTNDSNHLNDVIAATTTEKPKPKYDESWTIIDAGKVKKIRVNRTYIIEGEGSPFIVLVGRKEIQCNEVEYEAARMVCQKKSTGCGSIRSAWIETTGRVYYK